VVEEHHEALPYWLEAVENGVLQASKVALIHIDAHPDMALPYWNTKLPSTDRLPRSGLPKFGSNVNFKPEDEEVLPLMSGNDVFIVAAVLYGLVDRIVWIYPDWDVKGPRHVPQSENFVVGKITAGWYHAHGRNYPCSCRIRRINTRQRKSANKKRLAECEYATADDEYTIPERKCRPVHTAQLLQMPMGRVQEFLHGKLTSRGGGLNLQFHNDSTGGSGRGSGQQRAITLAQQSGFYSYLKGGNGVILDVDEDYFSVMADQDEVTAPATAPALYEPDVYACGGSVSGLVGTMNSHLKQVIRDT
jgi:hypothetical protein